MQVPFVSDALLPEQRGEADAVIDYRAHNLNRTNGHERAANHLCVRLSWNGVHIHQLCDPNDAAGRTTGVVRAAVENFFHDLKRAHFIDAQVLLPPPPPCFGCFCPSLWVLIPLSAGASARLPLGAYTPLLVPQTRAVSLTMGLHSNHIGMGLRMTLLFETTAAGAVLPSYDMQVRPPLPSGASAPSL